MISEAHGNLLAAEADAIVNTVNTVGVMGKGIALQFKKRFPANFKAYSAACNDGQVELGKMFVFDAGQLVSPRWIINFPTKGHWKSRSKLTDIASGLDDLATVLTDLGIGSIALPPLGCGLGGLDWSDVKPLIEAKLGDLDIDVVLYPPEGAPSAASMAPTQGRPKMSNGKAALVKLIDRYSPAALGTSVIEIQKLMYFLQVAGEPLKLNYVKGIYGPYADNLRHVLHRVEGHFLSGFGDGTDPVPDAVPITILEGAAAEAKSVVAANPDLQARIERVLTLAEGFESTYGMELLATVHWAATEDGCNDRDAVATTVQQWNRRKEQLFTPHHIDAALDQLIANGWLDDAAFARTSASAS